MAEEEVKNTASPAAEQAGSEGDKMALDSKPDVEQEKKAPEGGAGTKPETDAAKGGADGDTQTTAATNAGEAAATQPNGSAATTDKKNGDKSRRKSTGVPEHKTKKGKKKNSKTEYHTDAKPGELYLARMKGHPAWPSIIADDEMLPDAISKSRPVTAPNADGTWRREDYAPGGKRHNERTFPLMFLYTNEFAWIPNGDLTTITPEECREVSEKNKGKSLLEAFREAAKGYTLEHYKGLLNDHQNAIIEEEQARAEREAEKEAEKARKAEKKAKRKSEANADEMEIDEAGESKPKSKKRKKEAGSDEEGKPAKTPKTPKLKLSNPKTPGTSDKSAKKKDTNGKSGKKKSAAKVGSDDDVDTPAAEEKPLTAQEKHEKLKEEIRYCRHKLQRSLLSRDSFPTDDEVTTCEPWLKRLELHPDLAADIILHTKIHKVLKGILKLPSIPKEEDFNFKKRSSELLSKWNKVLAEAQTAADPKAADRKEASANGEPKAPSKDEKEGDGAEKKTADEASGKEEGKGKSAEKAATPSNDPKETTEKATEEQAKPDDAASKAADAVDVAA